MTKTSAANALLRAAMNSAAIMSPGAELNALNAAIGAFHNRVEVFSAVKISAEENIWAVVNTIYMGDKVSLALVDAAEATRMMVDVPNTIGGDDSAVFSRDALDDDDAAKFAKPWLFDTTEHGVQEFDTEDAACAAQRAYRAAKGFDPMTGAVTEGGAP